MCASLALALVLNISTKVAVILDPCYYKNVPIWQFNKSSTTCNTSQPGIVGGVRKLLIHKLGPLRTA